MNPNERMKSSPARMMSLTCERFIGLSLAGFAATVSTAARAAPPQTIPISAGGPRSTRGAETRRRGAEIA